MSLTLDKEYYYVGDVIEIHYTFPKHDPKNKVHYSYYLEGFFSHNQGVQRKKFSSEGGLFDITLEIKTEKCWEGSKAYAGCILVGSRIAKDKAVTLVKYLGKNVIGEIKKYLRLRQPKFKPIPGALTILTGSRFNSYDFPVVQLNLPSSIKDVSNFSVVLHYLPTKTQGGAIESVNFKRPMHSYSLMSIDPIVSHSQKITVKNKRSELFSTGTYELRLIQQIDEYSSGRYIVDSVRFEVVKERWSKTIRVLSPENLNVNEPITLQIDWAALPFKDDEYPYMSCTLFLYKVVDDNAETSGYSPFYNDIVTDDVHLRHVEHIDYQKSMLPDQDIVFKPVKLAGKYIFSLEIGSIVWDSLEVNVTGRLKRDDLPEMDETTKELYKKMGAVPKFDTSYIQIGDKVRFIQGEKISVEVFSSGLYGSGGVIKAVLYNASFSYNTELGSLIKEWDVVSGKKMAWTISENLSVGEYRLALKEILKDKSDRTVVYPHRFQIIPRFGEAKIEINDKKSFLTGETMKMDFIVPRSMKHEDYKLSYSIIRKGGFLPGCARVKDSIHMSTHQYLENGLKNITIRAPEPGNYLVQFVAMPRYPGSSHNGTFLLAETFFSTDIKWEPGGLLFPSGKDEFTYGESIPVTINVRLDLGLVSENYGADNDPGKYVLEVYRQGDVTYGGAYRLPEQMWLPAKALVNDKYSPEHSSTIIVKGNDQAVLDVEKIKENLPPGGYEFRLFTDYGGFLIARLPFEILEPDSPFPLEGGNPDFPRPSGIGSSGQFQTLKIGEFLDQDTCQESLLKPTVEKMELKFVHFENGKYVDVPEPIDFGAGFYLQGQLEEEASRGSYLITLTTSQGDKQEVDLFPLEDDPRIVRSERLYLIWHPKEEVSE